MIIVVLCIVRCSGDEDFTNPNLITGEWTVTQVVFDGTLQEEWRGVQLIFEGKLSDRGVYSMKETPYDSIWAAGGTWAKSPKPQELILNDTLSISYQIYDNELTISSYLPWTARSVCADDICMPKVSGEGEFKFQR